MLGTGRGRNRFPEKKGNRPGVGKKGERRQKEKVVRGPSTRPLSRLRGQMDKSEKVESDLDASAPKKKKTPRIEDVSL